jgi:plastocyanin
MSMAFRLIMMAVLATAVLIGWGIGHRQGPTTSAAPVPTTPPTAVPRPSAGAVDILGPGDSPHYNPIPVTVRVGQTVTWVNHDQANHTATADNGAFDSGGLSAGQKYTWTPRHAGRFPYGSYLDPSLRGTVIVQP